MMKLLTRSLLVALSITAIGCSNEQSEMKDIAESENALIPIGDGNIKTVHADLQETFLLKTGRLLCYASNTGTYAYIWTVDASKVISGEIRLEKAYQALCSAKYVAKKTTLELYLSNTSSVYNISGPVRLEPYGSTSFGTWGKDLELMSLCTGAHKDSCTLSIDTNGKPKISFGSSN